MRYKLGKNRKIVISFDDSGEMMVLWNTKHNELVRTADPMLYNYFRGNSSYKKLPLPASEEKFYEWRYK